MKKVTQRNITEFENLDLELYFATEVLKLRSLHYGYWEPNEELSLKNVPVAQARYTETLLEHIPEGVKKVLDVGSGIGDNARALEKKGYEVVALSPDRNHAKYYKNSENPRLRFVTSQFETFSETGSYDMILMSESHNYFPLQKGFEQCKKLLRSGGYLYISGMFRKDGSREAQQVFPGLHIEKDYIEYATRAGFRLQERVDITQEVLPTLTLAFQIYSQWIPPMLSMATHYFRATAKWKTKILSFLFRKQLVQLGKIQNMYLQRLNPETFQARAEYVRLVFKMEREQ